MDPRKTLSFFFFSETLNVHQGEAEATIEVEGKQNPLFPLGPVINLLYLQPQSWKIKTAKKKKKKMICFMPLQTVQWLRWQNQRLGSKLGCPIETLR